jgi:hypothetical protein
LMLFLRFARRLFVESWGTVRFRKPCLHGVAPTTDLAFAYVAAKINPVNSAA